MNLKPHSREHWCLLPVPVVVAGWALLAFFVVHPNTFGLETHILLFSKFAVAAFLLGGVGVAVVHWAGRRTFLRPRCPKCRSPMHERFGGTVRFKCTGCGWAYDSGKDYSTGDMPSDPPNP